MILVNADTNILYFTIYSLSYDKILEYLSCILATNTNDSPVI